MQSQNQQIVDIRAIRVRHGLHLQSLTAEYVLLGQSIFILDPPHGGQTSEPEYRVPIPTGEMLTEVRGLTDHFFINDLTFVTTDGSGVMRGYSLHGQTTSWTHIFHCTGTSRWFLWTRRRGHRCNWILLYWFVFVCCIRPYKLNSQFIVTVRCPPLIVTLKSEFRVQQNLCFVSNKFVPCQQKKSAV